MSNLKERIDNQTETPDTKVWDSIDRTLKVRQYLRTAGLIAGAAVVAGIGMVIATSALRSATNDDVAANSNVAQAVAVPVQTSANSTEAEPISTLPSDMATTHVTVAKEVRSIDNTSAATHAAEPQTPPLSETPAVVQNTYDNDNSTAQTVADANAAQKQEAATAMVGTTADGSVAEVKSQVAANANNEPAAQDIRHTEYTSKNSTDTIVEQQNLWLPNAIRPNDDNEKNRYFKPIFTKPDEVDHYEMQIFSRGGHRIYTSKRLADEGWDGKSEGQYVPTGVYVYLITYRDANRIVRQKRGTVTVIYNK